MSYRFVRKCIASVMLPCCIISLQATPLLALDTPTEEAHTAPVESVWEVKDFLYDGDAVLGYSESGLAKIKDGNHTHLVLPEASEDGTPLQCVAEGAFATNTKDRGDWIPLEEVTIPEGYTEIGKKAFMRNHIASLALPNSLTHIDAMAFNSNPLQSLQLSEGLIDIGDNAFVGKRGESHLEELVIPASVEHIGRNAFLSNDIQRLTFNEKGALQTIDALAFGLNPALAGQTILLPSGVQTIDKTAFNPAAKGPFEGEKVHLRFSSDAVPSTLAEGDYFDFAQTGSPEEGVKPSNWEVQDFTFADPIAEDTVTVGRVLTGLSPSGEAKIKAGQKDLVLPTTDDKGEPIHALGTHAFFNLKDKLGGIHSVTIPDTYDHVALAWLKNENIGALELVPGKAVFARSGIQSVRLSPAMKLLPTSFLSTNELKEVEIPEGVEIIGPAAFYTNHLQKVHLPSSVQEVQDAAFRSNDLESLTFDDNANLFSIHRLAFANNRLTEVHLPPTFKEKDGKKPILGAQAFLANTGQVDLNGYVAVYVPDASSIENLDDARTNKNLSSIVNPTPEDRLSVDDLNTKVWDTKDFIYEGTAVKGFSKRGQLKVRYNKHLVIPDTTPDGKPVTAIMGTHWEKNADGERVNVRGAFFGGKRNYLLESVTLPDTITYIGVNAFQNNRITGTLKLPRDLEILDTSAFAQNNINEIIWGERLERIGHVAFWKSDLGSVTIPHTVKSIGQAAFRKTNLHSLAFEEPSALESIDRYAFAENALTTVHIPASLKSIGYQAFLKNTGEANYDNKVVLRTPEGNNPQNLFDDYVSNAFVVDPDRPVDKEQLEALKRGAEALHAIHDEGKDKHDAHFFTLLDEFVDYVDKTLAMEHPSHARVLAALNQVNFITQRKDLSHAVRLTQKADLSQYDPAVQSLFARLLPEAEHALRNIEATPRTLKENTQGLHAALDAKGSVDIYRGLSSQTQLSDTYKGYDTELFAIVQKDTLVGLLDAGSRLPFSETEEDEQPSRGYFDRALSSVSGSLAGRSIHDLPTVDTVTGATHSGVADIDALQNALKAEPKGHILRLEAPIKGHQNIAGVDKLFDYIGRIKVHVDHDGTILSVSDDTSDVTKGSEPYWATTWQGLDQILRGKNYQTLKDTDANYLTTAPQYDVISTATIGSEAMFDAMKKNTLHLPAEEKEHHASHGTSSATGTSTKKEVPSTPTITPQAGYVHGYPDQTIRPDQAITRAEFAAMLDRLAKNDATGKKAWTFTDTADSFAEAAIDRVTEKGWMSGYPDGAFRPNQAITRGEVASVLARYLKLNENASHATFSGVKNHWARSAIEALSHHNYLAGYPDGSFKPNQAMTRAEVVSVLNKAFAISATDEHNNVYSDLSRDHWAYGAVLAASNAQL